MTDINQQKQNAQEAAQTVSDEPEDMALILAMGDSGDDLPPPSGPLSGDRDARRKAILQAAMDYARRGWKVIPLHWVTDEGVCSCHDGEKCQNPGKHPIHKGWPQVASSEANQILEWWAPNRMLQPDWWPSANVGIVTGTMSQIFALDNDAYNGGDLTLARYRQRHGEDFMPVTRVHQTGSGGQHYIFKAPPFTVRNSARKRVGPGIDIRGEHGFIVAPPSVSAKGPYEVTEVHDIDPAEAPEWLLGLLHEEDSGQRGTLVAGIEPATSTGIARRYTEAAVAGNVEKMRATGPDTHNRNDTLNEVAFSLGTLGGAGLLSEDAAWLAIHEAALSTGLEEPEVRRTFLNGWRAGLKEPRQIQWNLAGDWPIRARTDIGMADRMADHFADVLRWCPERKTWMVYSNGVWLAGSPDHGEWMAQHMVRRLGDTEGQMYDDQPVMIPGPDGVDEATPSPQEDFQHWVATKAHTVKAISAAARLSRGLPLMQISESGFDPDPLLLNCLNGVADLVTGKRLDHDPELRMTLQCPVSYHPGATAPQFHAFLERVQPDAEVRAYLRRVMGYSVTALTSEQVFFLHHGKGANGKSVLFDLIGRILGSYSQVVPVETLLSTQIEGRVPNDVARMNGRRMLQASEPKAGKGLDEAKIKGLTGGETVTARYMRGEFFEFKPVGTIHLATNHLPRMTDDPATWRRVKLITWDVIIPEEERDPDLANRIFREEAEGVLAWLVQGAMEWREMGLATPQVLIEAAQDYRDEEDFVAQFVRTCLLTGLPYSTTRVGSKVGEIWSCYNEWAKDNGAPEYKQAALTARLKLILPDYKRTNGATMFTNTQVNPEVVLNAP
jgi:putative DNA primase/helicase